MLQTIVETKKEELKNFSMPGERELPSYHFFDALMTKKRALAVIAEVKKASPSKGVIVDRFDPLAIAKQYEQAGVDAISVLTDRVHFQGDPDYLPFIKQHVRRPLLRKDFIIDRRQIEASKRLGADAILLIARILSPLQLKEFYFEAKELGLDCVVECHTQEEIEAVLNQFTPKIIGINNRDLHSFTTSLTTTENLRPLVPDSVFTVSESGIETRNDVVKLERMKVDGMLIGEAFMRADDMSSKMKELFGEER